MQDLPLRVLKYCRENSLIGQGERIMAGVSGGADSVCLFFVLKQLKNILGFELFAVHVEHGIRGQNAKRDEEFVRILCKNEEIPLLVYHEDVPGYAADNGLSMEEAARILRYADFERAAEELSADRIAVAHHMNDQAETFLFHLIRGSGLSGLSGMRPKRGRIIRPFLFLERREIEAFAEENSLDYVVDETNSDPEYSRNRIRSRLLPEAGLLCPEAVSHIYRAGEIIAEAQEYIQKQSQKLYTKSVTLRGQGGELYYEAEIPVLRDEDHILQTYVIRQILTELYRGGKDLTSVHIEDVLGLLVKQSGRRISLPKGGTALRVNDRLKIGFFRETEQQQEVSLDLNGTTEYFGERFVCEIAPYDPAEGFPRKTYTKWFDYDKMNSGLCVRTRRSGDRIAVMKEHSGQSLKKYFTNEKIPADERDRIPLIAAGNEIVWIVGYRISERFKLDADSKRVLKIRFEGPMGSENGEEIQDSGK